MDIIAAIDSATGCQYCGGPLGDSPSDDFCAPRHQAAWLAARTVPLERDDEPVELAAHVFNATEWHHPETCVECTENRWCPDRSAGADAMVLRPGDGRSVVAALRRAATHGGHYLAVSNAFNPGTSPAENQATRRSAGEVGRSGLGFDGVHDAPLTHFTMLRGGQIRVNIVPHTVRFNNAAAHLGEAAGSAAAAFARLQDVMPGASTAAGAGPLEDLLRWAEIYRDAQRTADDYQHGLTAMRVVVDEAVDFAPWDPTPSVDTSRLSGATFDLAHIDLADVTARGAVTADMIRNIRQAATPEPLAVTVDVRQRALDARRNRNTGPPPPKRRAPRNLPPRRA